jgi:signal transduction histidine kinase
MPEPATNPDLSALESRILHLQRELDRERSQGEIRSRIFRLLSHEFRTPLTIILSSTELLQVYGEKWGQEKRSVHLGKIVNAVGLLSSQLDDVLLFNKMQADAVECARTEEPWGLLQAVATLLEDGEIDAQRFRVALELDAAVTVDLDRPLFLQVLRNLLHNALRYTDGAVRIAAHAHADRLRIAIEDEGEGFPDPEREHLFEPFFRGTSSQGKPGTGLGLAVVRECTRIMGGEIRYEAREPKGSRFVLEFREPS